MTKVLQYEIYFFINFLIDLTNDFKKEVLDIPEKVKSFVADSKSLDEPIDIDFNQVISHVKRILTTPDEALDDEMSEFTPDLLDSDINQTLVKNLLESIKSEVGSEGPASTLMKNLKVNLPDIE